MSLLKRNILVNLSHLTPEKIPMSPCELRQSRENEKLKIVDQVLNQMLGRKATKTLYDHMEATHDIQRHRIAQNLDLFNYALREYLGPGAAVIEHAIHRNIQLELEESEASLPDRAKVLKLA